MRLNTSPCENLQDLLRRFLNLTIFLAVHLLHLVHLYLEHTRDIHFQRALPEPRLRSINTFQNTGYRTAIFLGAHRPEIPARVIRTFEKICTLGKFPTPTAKTHQRRQDGQDSNSNDIVAIFIKFLVARDVLNIRIPLFLSGLHFFRNWRIKEK